MDFSASGAYCVPTGTQRTRALVTRVLSGDTIEVAIGNDALKVRYIGLDAPGIAPQMEWQGPQAVSANGDLVSGKYVVLIKDLSDTDVEGALLRYVFVDNLFVNYELLRRGFAQTRIQQPDTSCEKAFLAAQSEAKTAYQGVWIATPTPTATITLNTNNYIHPLCYAYTSVQMQRSRSDLQQLSEPGKRPGML